MANVTSQEIMEAIGIGNSATLTRWHQMGLIPSPTVGTHPCGRGKMAYWPEWVLQRCVRIKQLKKTGKSLVEIKELLSNAWKMEAKEYKRRYRFVEVSEQMDRQAALMNLREAVENLLREWLSNQQRKLRQPRVDLIAGTLVEKAILLVEGGINPVLIFDQDEFHVTADFVVSQQLAKFRSLDRPLFVVPLFDELSRYFRDRKTFPVKPTVRPSERVAVSSPEGEDERKFVVLDDWSFEIAASKRRRRGKQ